MLSIPFPRVLRIEPASQCNLSCAHCPTGTIEMARDVMSDQLFELIINEVKIHKDEIKVIVLYHGGEPLLNKNFANMVRTLKQINPLFFIKTVSNGMALTASRSQELLDCGLDSIEFSLDGSSAEESQYIRRKSDTQKIITNIKQLIKLKCEQNKSFPEIYIATTQFYSDAKISGSEKLSEPLWLKKTFLNDDVDFKVALAMKWPHMGDSGLFDFIQIEDTNNNCKKCTHVIDTMTIRSDGTVVACCFDLTNELVMGSIKENSLNQIWNNSAYKTLRSSLNNREFISICSHCLVVNSPIYLVPKWEESQFNKGEK